MPATEHHADGINEPELLWILIALARGEVDEEDVATAFGLPETMVDNLLTMAGMRGQTAIERALLRSTVQVPPLVIVRSDDIESALSAVGAWVPDSVVEANPVLRKALARLRTITRKASVWTNN